VSSLGRTVYIGLQVVCWTVTLAALIVVLAGCGPDDTRRPNDTDVVRAPNTYDPCRCGTRPTLETTP